MLKVGLTGGIASGKSTVCRTLADLGAKVLDADEIAREAVRPGLPAWTKLRHAFGSDFFHADGSLNRRLLRKVIFSDPERRGWLNEIVHPEVVAEIQRTMEKMEAMTPDAVVVVDVPLLLEVGAAGSFDRVLVVYVDEDAQLARLMQRDGLSKEEAHQILDAQLPLRDKVAKADFVIDNSGSLEETQVQVERVWQELAALARSQGTR